MYKLRKTFFPIVRSKSRKKTSYNPSTKVSSRRDIPYEVAGPNLDEEMLFWLVRDALMVIALVLIAGKLLLG